MKYLCIAPDGSLEIWEGFENYNEYGALDPVWNFVLGRDAGVFTLNAKIMGPPGFWGRQIIEEWEE